jgi:hypothetical protein
MRNTDKIDRCNQHTVGENVVYCPAKYNDGTLMFKNCKRTTTRSRAFLNNSNEPVIFLNGISGYVHVDHIVFGGSLVENDSPIYDKKFKHLW